MKRYFFYILVMISSISYAKEDYKVIFDPDFSPFIGAEDIITTQNASQKVFDKFLPIPPKTKVWTIMARFLELGLIYEPLSNVEMVLQHEVFGHGYRLRDIGSKYIDIEKYEIEVPPPYQIDGGGGATYYAIDNPISVFQDTSISIAGVEATSILAHRLKLNWLYNKKLPAKQASLYLSSQHDLTNYIFSMKDDFYINDGHDIRAYINSLNSTYEEAITKDDVKKRVLINFLDPFTYYSIWSYFTYIFYGKDVNIPMFDIKGVKYLPSFRLGLTPYGYEYYFENYLIKNSPLYFYLRYGDHVNSSYGLGLEYLDVYQSNKNAFSFRVDLFYQPKIYVKSTDFVFENVYYGYSEEDLRKKILGAFMSLTFEHKIKKSDFWTFLQLSYKSKGFVPGEALRSAFNIRYGISFKKF